MPLWQRGRVLDVVRELSIGRNSFSHFGRRIPPNYGVRARNRRARELPKVAAARHGSADSSRINGRLPNRQDKRS